MELSIDTRAFQAELDRLGERAIQAAEIALQDCADDLERTAADTAPINKGTLRRSSYSERSQNGDTTKITVEFAIRENGFNYAILMHEGTYNLGVQSRSAGGGVGMSGTRYNVGRKYLQRVIDGEKVAYENHIADMIRNVTGAR